jgi:hypothetical protein
LQDDKPQVAVIKEPSASAKSPLKPLSPFAAFTPPSVAAAMAALAVSVFFSKMSKHVFSPIYQDISYDIS